MSAAAPPAHANGQQQHLQSDTYRHGALEVQAPAISSLPGDADHGNASEMSHSTGLFGGRTVVTSATCGSGLDQLRRAIATAAGSGQVAPGLPQLLAQAAVRLDMLPLHLR